MVPRIPGVRVPLLLLVAVPLLASCTQTRTVREVDALLSQTMEEAHVRQQAGDTFESLYLAWMVNRVDPHYPGSQEMLDEVPAWITEAMDRPVLGSNVAVREPISRPWWARVLWYVPDRVLDLLDVFSFDVHLGFGVFADVHATRALQVQFGGRSVAGFGWHDGRSLGVQTQGQAGIGLFMLGAEAYSAAKAGTSGVRAGAFGVGGFHAPGDELYQRYRDYWAIGAGATAVVAGVDVDIHPVEIFDFLVGWATFDPLNDDFGDTEGLDLTSHEEQLSKALGAVLSDEASLQDYLAWRGQQPADERSAEPAPAEEDAAGP